MLLKQRTEITSQLFISVLTHLDRLVGISPLSPLSRILLHRSGPEGTELNWFQGVLWPKREKEKEIIIFYLESQSLLFKTMITLAQKFSFSNNTCNYIWYSNSVIFSKSSLKTTPVPCAKRKDDFPFQSHLRSEAQCSVWLLVLQMLPSADYV